MEDNTLTMRRVAHNGDEKPTFLELVLGLEGEFRRSLGPTGVTPLQAGLILYLQRHMDANLTDAAASLGVSLPTLSTVVSDLGRKRSVTKRRSDTDARAVCLSLSRRGEALALRIKDHVRDVKWDFTPVKETAS